MLLELKQPALALEQFEATLKKEPGRFRSLYGAAHAADLAQNREASVIYFGKLLEISSHADQPGRMEIMEANRMVSHK